MNNTTERPMIHAIFIRYEDGRRTLRPVDHDSVTTELKALGFTTTGSPLKGIPHDPTIAIAHWTSSRDIADWARTLRADLID